MLACAGARNNEPSDFINGVDVLVTSPPRLLKLVGNARPTRTDRCCHLVVKEGDHTLSMWHKQLGEIIVSWRKQRNGQKGSSPDQLVMVAKRWNGAVKQFTIVEINSPVGGPGQPAGGCHLWQGGDLIVPAFLTDFLDRI